MDELERQLGPAPDDELLRDMDAIAGGMRRIPRLLWLLIAELALVIVVVAVLVAVIADHG